MPLIMQNAMGHKHLRIRTAGSLQFIKCHPNGACIVLVSVGPLISLQVFLLFFRNKPNYYMYMVILVKKITVKLNPFKGDNSDKLFCSLLKN